MRKLGKEEGKEGRKRREGNGDNELTNVLKV